MNGYCSQQILHTINIQCKHQVKTMSQKINWPVGRAGMQTQLARTHVNQPWLVRPVRKATPYLNCTFNMKPFELIGTFYCNMKP